MSSASVSTTDSDGDVVITKTVDSDGVTVVTGPAAQLPLLHQHRGMIHLGPDGAYVHSGKPLDAGSFFAGLMLGALLYFILQTAMRWHARREAKGYARAAAIGPQAEDRMAAEVAALARRTATLETIVTDPAHRTAREIEALR